MTIWTDWSDCYDKSLKGLITQESFAHPAKVSRALTERIFDHGAKLGYWQSGDLIVDPFGGICTTGLIGAYRGYQVLSVELERRFVELGQANIEMNRRTMNRFGLPVPTHIQGDSRRLCEIVAGAVGVVTSPPYGGNDDRDFTRNDRDRRRGYQPERYTGSFRRAYSGESAKTVNPTNAGDMPTGNVDAVIGAITSPPRERISARGHRTNYRRSSVLVQRQAYSDSPDNIGTVNTDTYWAAVAQVYQQLYALLPAGGAAAVVVKDYVKNKQRVPLCDQTAELLTTIGFTVVERCRARLVRERRATTLYGDEHVTRIERKSFFRRMAERKGSPRVDWEEVIWAVK